MNKTFVLVSFFLLLLTVNAAAQDGSTVNTDTVPAGFKTNGCTLFPDGNYRDCCVAHDLSYFNGGALRERLRADNRLFKCVANKKGWWNKLVAPVMWMGVRVGGVSFLPTPFRWGFGQQKKRKSKSPPAISPVTD